MVHDILGGDWHPGQGVNPTDIQGAFKVFFFVFPPFLLHACLRPTTHAESNIAQERLGLEDEFPFAVGRG